MEYYFMQNAVKDLRGLSAEAQKRIITKLDFYMNADDPLTFAKPLSDKKFGEYRFRVGEYRIIFDIRKDTIVILAMGHRRDIYK